MKLCVITTAGFGEAVITSTRVKELSTKVALVTGASGGIGQAIAERLAREGARVIVHYSSSEAKAHAVVERIRLAGSKAVAIRADLTSVPAIKELFAQAQRHYGAPDIVVANAGVPSREPVQDVTEAHYDEVFAVNARGAFFVLQEASRHVPDGGRIINISSGQTIHPSVDFALYSGSKAATNAFVRVLAQELGPRKVTVNSIVAGPIDVGFLKDAAPEYKQGMASASALKRLGTADDVAGAVVLLSSADAQFITGQDLVVDGGATHF